MKNIDFRLLRDVIAIPVSYLLIVWYEPAGHLLLQTMRIQEINVSQLTYKSYANR